MLCYVHSANNALRCTAKRGRVAVATQIALMRGTKFIFWLQRTAILTTAMRQKKAAALSLVWNFLPKKRATFQRSARLGRSLSADHGKPTQLVFMQSQWQFITSNSGKVLVKIRFTQLL